MTHGLDYYHSSIYYNVGTYALCIQHDHQEMSPTEDFNRAVLASFIRESSLRTTPWVGDAVVTTPFGQPATEPAGERPGDGHHY